MFQRLFFKLLPVQIMIIAMGSINSIVDGAAAGRFIDAAAVGVIGLYYTVVRVLEAVGAILLGGSSILCGRYMGSGDLDRTSGLFSLNLTVTFGIGVILTAVSFLFPAPLARALGANSALEGALISYIRGYGFGIVPQLLAQQTAMFLQLERKNSIGYAGVAAMILCNIVLDIVLVKVLQMGTFGLALATSISNWVYFLILIPYYFTKKAQLAFSFSRIDAGQFWPLIKIGFPGAALVFYLAARALVLNNILLKYAGSDGLSAQSAFGMICGLEIAFCIGIGSVVRMMTSVLIGEEDRDGIRTVMKTALTKALILSAGLALVMALLSGPIASLFFADRSAHVHELARQLFLIYALCIPLTLLIQIFCNHLQASGHNLIVNILSFLDGFLAMVAPSLILAPAMGALGVWLANPIGLCITLLAVFAYACICSGRFPAGFDDWLFFKKDFGVSEEERLEMTVESMEEAMATSVQVQDFCREHDLPSKICFYAALSLEEMVGNVVSHGFAADSKKHQIMVRVVLKEDHLLLRIKDDCIPFDPKERAGQFSADEPEKNIGIRMIMKLANEVTYQNLLGLNVLTVRFPAAAA